MQAKSVAIIGMGAVFPKALNLKDFWRLILNGRDAITDVPESHWSPEDYFDTDRAKADLLYCKRGGFLPPCDFDPAEFGIPPNNLDATDTSQLLGLVAASMALNDAGYGKNAVFNRDRASVILGVTGTQELVIPLASRLSHPRWRKAMQLAGIDEHTAAEVMDLLSKSYVEWQENSFPGLLGNVVAGRISNRLDLRGTNCVVDAACASSLSALHLALLELESGKSDLVVSGGVDTLNDVFMHMCFCKTGVLSPTGDIRPFAQNADGTVLGEGIGMLALKRLEDAERDGDNIYAVIKGLGSSSDGKSQSIYAPNAKGQERALRNAYQIAGVEPETVALIEGHGTGTLVGDKVEVSALQAVFNNAKPRQTALGSIKALVGHTKAAAGSAGIIKVALALHNKVLPPSAKIAAPNQILNSADSPFYLNVLPRPWVSSAAHKRRAGVSAFGFGGSNFHAVLEEYEPRKQHVSWDNTVQILAFSANELNDLEAQITGFAELKLTQMDAALAWHAMETRKTFDGKARLRLLIALNETADIAASLAQALEICRQNTPRNTGNIFFGHGEPKGALAFVFPGQGSQYPHMGANYAARFPQALSALETFNAAFNDSKALSDYIYPTAAFSEANRKIQFAELTQTQVAQPALGAVSLGLTEILAYFGVKPQFTIGHSFGELSALQAAGWLNQNDFAHMAAARGRAVAKACAQAEPGGMLAVYATASELTDFLAQHKLNVCLANINAPGQTVLSGGSMEMETTAGLLRNAGFKCTRLEVSGAFHSKFVANAVELFAAQTKNCVISPTGIEVISNLSGEAYPQNTAAAGQILCDQIKSPVNFMRGVQTLYAKGARVFIEVGPKTVLSGLINKILDGEDFEVLSLDQSKGQNHLQDLAVTLCRLAALGHAVKLNLWEETAPKPRAQVMRVPLSGANLGPRGITGNAKPRPALTQARPNATSTLPKAAQTDLTAQNLPMPTALQNYEQLATSKNIIMNDNNNLNIIEQSLNAISQLQEQVTRAHEKFLETQAEANRTLQNMLAVLAGGQPVAHHNSGVPQITPVVAVPKTTPPLTAQPAPILAQAVTAQSAPQPVPVQTAAALATTPAADTNIAQTLLKVVGELTGYPEDMLQLDMQIEGDLGIDSIKRVEILSTLEERIPNLPHANPEEMAALKTLGEIVAVFSENHAANNVNPLKNAPAVSKTVLPNHDLTDSLLAVVSELTGYPKDMLQLDMQIEGDLGIDSIKRVEILSTLEERMPNLPHTDPEEMAALKTLGEIVAVFGDNSTGPAKTAPAVSQATVPNHNLTDTLLDVVSELTGYPKDMLQLDMQIEGDLGIDSIKRVEILSTLEERMPNLPHTDPEEMAALKTLGQIAAALSSDKPNAAQPKLNDKPPASQMQKNAGVLPQRRIIKLVETPTPPAPAFNFSIADKIVLAGGNTALLKTLSQKLTDMGAKTLLLNKADVLTHSFDNLRGLILTSDSDASDEGQDLALNFKILRHAGPALLKNDKPFAVGLSFLDGAFGFKQTQQINAAAAGLAGLLKTIQIEWPGCNCRMLDLDPGWHDHNAQAAAVLAEIYLADGLETGLNADKRLKIDLELTGMPTLEPQSFGANDLFVISGGARGVTAQTALELCRTFKPKLALLGRSPEPFTEPDWLENLTEQSSIKKAVIEHDFANAAPKPKDVDARFKYYMANREINANLNAMRALGANARYYSVDILDLTALRQTFAKIKADLGDISVLVHGAGVLEDKLLLDKTDAQFARVYATKVTGLHNLLNACNNARLKALALFSSVTARMGNKGQCDYAASNEILNKTAQNMALTHKNLKVTSFNWGPWDGGMVSPLLKKEFTGLKVDLVDMRGGAEAFVRELSGSEKAVEVVFGSGFEALLPVVKAGNAPHKSAESMNLSVNAGLNHLFNLEVSPKTFPLLNAHIIDGNYVMPFAVSLELMAHAAMHENPGLKLGAILNARVYKGLVLPQANPKAEIGLYAGKAVINSGGQIEVNVELKARQNGKSHIVAGAQILLASALPKNAAPPAPAQPAKTYAGSINRVYDQILFHGPMLQGLTDIIACNANGAAASIICLNNPHDIMAHPLRSNFLTDPLAIDCAFQLASLWCFENYKTVSLPGSLESIRFYGKFTAGANIKIVLDVTQVNGQIMNGSFKFCNEKEVIAEIQGFSAVMNENLNQAFKPHLKIAV